MVAGCWLNTVAVLWVVLEVYWQGSVAVLWKGIGRVLAGYCGCTADGY